MSATGECPGRGSVWGVPGPGPEHLNAVAANTYRSSNKYQWRAESLSIPLLIQQIFTEHLLGAKHCPRS